MFLKRLNEDLPPFSSIPVLLSFDKLVYLTSQQTNKALFALPNILLSTPKSRVSRYTKSFVWNKSVKKSQYNIYILVSFVKITMESWHVRGVIKIDKKEKRSLLVEKEFIAYQFRLNANIFKAI